MPLWPWSRRDLHALTGAYALDALDGEAEERRFVRHLRRCPACTDEVRRFREVATSLAFQAAAPPPAELRDRVMSAAARTRQLPPEAARQRRFRIWIPRLPQNLWLPRLALATAAAGIAAVVALSIVLSGTTQQLNTARAQSQAIAGVLAAPDVRSATGKVATGGVVTVLLSAERHQLVVSSTGLASLTRDQVYELWFIGPSQRQKSAIRRAGLLPPAVAGQTTPSLASGLVTGDILAMTVEPAGGTSQPTTTPILELSLAKPAVPAVPAKTSAKTTKHRRRART